MDEIAVRLNHSLLVIRNMQRKHGSEEVKPFKLMLLEDAKKHGYRYDKQLDEFINVSFE